MERLGKKAEAVPTSAKLKKALSRYGRGRVANAVRRREGPLTSELVQRPADFGLGRLPERLIPDATTDVVCGFCSTGCGLTVHLKENRAINVTPSAEYPVNAGMACPKGWESLSPLKASDRATTPYLRGASGQLEPIDWDRALDVFCRRFRSIQERYGPDSLAFLSTGQITTEEMALLGGLAKFGMGIRHGDGNTRQCMATAAVAYRESFGFDAPPFTYRDFEESDVIVLIGANLCIAHPIMWQRIKSNAHDPAVVVIDPRRTETAAAATHHYAVRPAGDLVLFYGLARMLLERGWIDSDYIDRHTDGFEEYAEHVAAFTPEAVQVASGIEANSLSELAELIGRGERVSFWWTMGVNQGHESVRTAQSIINLALMTGNIGRPGTGANSITGQTNAMGSRLFSNTTGLLGGRDFLNAGHRREVARILDIAEVRIPDVNSWSYDRIIDGVREGTVKGLWVIATNPSHSWIDRARFDQDVLAKLEFLVVQDMYHTTDTAERADLLLPAAGAGEKDGTVINSERRIGLYKKTAAAPGHAIADFYIFKLIAERWGCGDLFRRWTSPETTFELLKELSRSQPCDFSGVDGYTMIDREGGVQWPLPAGTRLIETQRRLFEDGSFYRESGRALFCFEEPRPLPEPVDHQYPLILLTGRGSSAQWHTNTRTAKSAVLRKLYPRDCYVEINAEDAAMANFAHGDTVRVESRRGSIEARAVVVGTLQSGQVFMPMHYEETNRLTFSAFDPYSRQPAYKACAVRVRRTASGRR